MSWALCDASATRLRPVCDQRASRLELPPLCSSSRGRCGRCPIRDVMAVAVVEVVVVVRNVSQKVHTTRFECQYAGSANRIQTCKYINCNKTVQALQFGTRMFVEHVRGFAPKKQGQKIHQASNRVHDWHRSTVSQTASYGFPTTKSTQSEWQCKDRELRTLIKNVQP